MVEIIKRNKKVGENFRINAIVGNFVLKIRNE